MSQKPNEISNNNTKIKFSPNAKYDSKIYKGRFGKLPPPVSKKPTTTPIKSTSSSVSPESNVNPAFQNNFRYREESKPLNTSKQTLLVDVGITPSYYYYAPHRNTSRIAERSNSYMEDLKQVFQAGCDTLVDIGLPTQPEDDSTKKQEFDAINNAYINDLMQLFGGESSS